MSMPTSTLPGVKEVYDAELETIDFSKLVSVGQPVILKGVFKHKALVKAGKTSSQAAMDHIRQYYSGRAVVTFLSPPEQKGRFFYNQDMTGMNFQSVSLSLDDFFGKTRVENFGCYAGSTDLPTYFPTMIEGDDLALPGGVFEKYTPLTSIWMGNRTTAAIHYDMSNNVAACMVGRRRFTLFPPDQIENLYPGPVQPTPAGQVVSMVDLNNPDFGSYPKFKQALESAQVCLFIPRCGGTKLKLWMTLMF